jgi:hypothetical protein
MITKPGGFLNRGENGASIKPAEPEIPLFWSARFYHALSWQTFLFKNFGKQKNDWAKKEMALAVRRILKEFKRQGASYQNNLHEVPSYSAGSLDPKQVRQLVNIARPFVLRGAAKHWGAVQNWNLDFFCDKFGDQTMTTKGDLLGSDSFEERRIADVVADLKAGKPIYSGFAEEIFLNNPSLHGDINREDILRMMGSKVDRKVSLTSFFKRGTISSIQMFLQGANSHTTYHMTKFHNFFVQIQGAKKWVLMDPRLSVGIQPCPSAAFYYVSTQEVDSPESPDSLYSYLPKVHTVIEPGDILFIPSYWWHDVRTYQSDHVIGMAIRASEWALDNLLYDALLLADTKTIPFFYKAFIKGVALTRAEDAVRNIDSDLKRLGIGKK